MFNLQILQRLSNSSFLTLTRDKFGQIIDHNFIFVSAHNKQKNRKKHFKPIRKETFGHEKEENNSNCRSTTIKKRKIQSCRIVIDDDCEENIWKLIGDENHFTTFFFV